MNFIKKLWLKIKTEYKFRKKLREIKKRDPFIYK
tara:strand:+ start:1388 stop:1489 length:102 start_codon:yes stop_codon:yes gene_type:complete